MATNARRPEAKKIRTLRDYKTAGGGAKELGSGIKGPPPPIDTATDRHRIPWKVSNKLGFSRRRFSRSFTWRGSFLLARKLLILEEHMLTEDRIVFSKLEFRLALRLLFVLAVCVEVVCTTA